MLRFPVIFIQSTLTNVMLAFHTSTTTMKKNSIILYLNVYLFGWKHSCCYSASCKLKVCLTLTIPVKVQLQLELVFVSVAAVLQ